MFGHHPVMFGIIMWKRPEQVLQLEAGASALAQQVEVSFFILKPEAAFRPWFIKYASMPGLLATVTAPSTSLS